MTTTSTYDAPTFYALRDAIRDEIAPLCDRFNHLQADDPERAPLRARITQLLEVEGRLLQAREGVLVNPPTRDEVSVALEAHLPAVAAAHADLRKANQAIAADAVAVASGRAAVSDATRRALIDHRAWVAEDVRIADEMHAELCKLLALVESD